MKSSSSNKNKQDRIKKKTSKSKPDLKNKKHEQSKTPLQGMLVSISALESANKDNTDTYKSLSEECIKAGAAISSQVHKKVQAVICTHNAVEYLTQRVRKGLKKDIPILDISWVRDSVSRGRRRDMNKDKYNLSAFASDVFQDRQENQLKETSTLHKNETNNDTSTIPSTEEMQCYCICHDTGVTDCEWCVDCNYH